MPRSLRFLFVILCLLFVAHSLFAQVQTGTPPFGSYGGGPDVINLANLNSHLTIPVLHKPGRGTDFVYDIAYDTSAWYPVASSGHQIWQPVSGTWGWQGLAPGGTSYITYAATQFTGTCYDGGPVSYYWWSYTNFVYVDPFGLPHNFTDNPLYYVTPGGANCPPNGPMPSTPQPGYANDGSGLTLYATPGSGGGASAYIVAANGAIISPPVNYAPPSGSGSSLVTDRNGNQLSSTNGVYTDTLGLHALTVAGIAPSNTTLTYTAPSGGSAQFIVKYVSHMVQTNFGCSGISEYGPINSSLVSEIDLPDGSMYTFAYEGTPGFSGNVTGRLASVTLPTGGRITYTYTGGSSGHITCADGSAATLTRTTPDGTWTYARTKVSGTQWQTIVTDPTPQANQTSIQFQGIYETQRQIYQGSSGGTLLQTVNTCYNGATSPCTGTAITVPILSRSVTGNLPSSTLTSKRVDSWSTFGMPTESDEYDFGTNTPGPLLRKTLITYAALGNSINAFSQTSTVCSPSGSASACGGTGTVIAQTTNSYDQTSVSASSGTPQHVSVSGSRGNLTTVTYLTSGSNTLSKTLTYYDTGTLKTATDVNSATTTFNYPDSTSTCGNAFPTSISEPLSLSRSMTWNCTGGVLTSATDENTKTTTTTYTDSYFWRPASVTDPITNATLFSYSTGNPAWVQQSLTFNGNQSINHTGIGLDGLGRPIQKSHEQAPGVSSWDQVTQSYDSFGRPWKTSMPCVTTGAWTCPTTATTTTYDVLGRVQQVTDGGGGYTSYAPNANDVLITVGPNPTGENTKRRQLEYDALGRLTSVCELTTVAGSGSCAQTTAATGFLTKYTYDLLGNVTGVTQNAQPGGSQQTRSFSYDGLSRLTSETNAESGTTTYSWDSSIGTSCGNSYPGDMTKKVDANGHWTCYIFDALHRLIAVGNSNQSATNPCKRFLYDNSGGYPGSTKPPGLTNTLGRLIEAVTDTCSGTDTIITDEWFSYDARGEVSDFYESTPHSGGYYHSTATYWANGVPNLLTGPGTYSVQYNVDGEGRIYSTAPSVGALNSTTYNAAGQPTQVTFASNDSDTFTYDPNTGRMTQYKFTVGTTPQSLIGNLTWNANGTLASQNITDPFNASDTQNCAYTHDDLTRIASVNCGTPLSQTFSYDAFGNISKSGTYLFQPIYNSATNRFASIPGVTVSYDAAGNVLYDGSHSYTWDVYGKPISIDSVGLTYDAFGSMVEQNRSGSYTEINYAPTGAKIELMNGQSYTKAFVPLPGGAVGVVSGASYFGHVDFLGNTKLASTGSRTVSWSLAYAPFGETYAISGTTDPAFTGQREDTVTTGLYDFPAREYSIQGRWSSPDPASLAAVDPSNPQSWNRYAYVMNNPLAYVDPLGLVQACPAGSGVNIVNSDGTTSCGPPADGGGGVDFCFLSGLCGGGGGGGPHISPLLDGPPDHSGGNSRCGTAPFLPCKSSGPPCLAGVGPLAPGQSYCDPCANATLSAAGVTAQQQIAMAQVSIAVGKISADASSSFDPVAQFLGGMAGYYEAVHTGGPNDIKNLPGPGYQNQIGVDAGNISFGITCPYGATFCQAAAGGYQFGAALLGKASFGSLRTFMDTSSDNASIKVGQAMRAAGCHE